MSYVSDAAVEAVLADLRVTREKRRAIQNMTKEQLQRYLVNLYRQGYEAGADAIREYLEETHAQAEADTMPFEEIKLDWEDVLSVIATVKGIGPKMLAAIDRKLREEY